MRRKQPQRLVVRSSVLLPRFVVFPHHASVQLAERRHQQPRVPGPRQSTAHYANAEECALTVERQRYVPDAAPWRSQTSSKTGPIPPKKDRPLLPRACSTRHHCPVQPIDFQIPVPCAALHAVRDAGSAVECDSSCHPRNLSAEGDARQQRARRRAADPQDFALELHCDVRLLRGILLHNPHHQLLHAESSVAPATHHLVALPALMQTGIPLYPCPYHSLSSTPPCL